MPAMIDTKAKAREAAERMRGFEKAFWGAPNDEASDTLMGLNRDIAAAETKLRAATDHLVALEEQQT